MARSRRYHRDDYDDYYGERSHDRYTYQRHERGRLAAVKMALTIVLAAVIFWGPITAQLGIEARNPINLIVDLINNRGDNDGSGGSAPVPDTRYTTTDDSGNTVPAADTGSQNGSTADTPPQPKEEGEYVPWTPPVYERVGGNVPNLGPGDSVGDFTDQRGRVWGGSNITIDGISTVYITTEQARACAQAEGTRAQLHNDGIPIAGLSVYYSVYGEPVPETTDENGMFPICHIEGIFIGAFDESIPAFSIAAPEAAVQAEYVQPVPTENGLVFVVDVSKIP